MGLKSWFSRWRTGAKSDNPYSDASFFERLGFRRTHAGVNVNYDTAMRHNDVYTCVRIKSESLGQLPVRLYKREELRHVEVVSGRTHEIFTKRPNPYQTWQDFIEQFAASIELLGRFAAEVRRNRYGNVYEIVPFKHQANFRPEMDANGRVYYTYTTNAGKGRVSTRTYDPSDVLVINNFTLDGYTGISTISQCALAIGSAVAGEEHAASLFENGAMPTGVLQTDESFGDDTESVQRLRQQWNELHTGTKNSGKTAILEYGLKYQPLTMTAVDAQLLEQRRLSREQIAAMFRVPLHMLQAKEAMKYNNVEQNNLSFFRDSLMPLAHKLESKINQLLPSNHFIKLDEKVFVRGDRNALVETVTAEVESGLISINEGRIELGRDAIEGGDVFAIKTNNLTFGKYTELDKIMAQAQQASAPAPKPANEEKPPKKPSSEEEN